MIRITVIGMSYRTTSNRCLAPCYGERRNDYIPMLGHDDYDSDFMSKTLTHITENKLDVYSGWMRAYDDNLQFTDVITSSSFINKLKDNGGQGLTVIKGKDF